MCPSWDGYSLQRFLPHWAGRRSMRGQAEAIAFLQLDETGEIENGGALRRSCREMVRGLHNCGARCHLFFPYYFPLTPSASASYLFGYNNRAAVLILLILVAAGVIGTRGLHLRLLAAANSQPIRRKVFLYSLAAVLLVCAALYLLTGRLGGFGESGYEIDRIWLTSIGKRPYIDFEWPFGVISLYVPLAIHRLLSLSIPQAYYIFWCLNCLAGAWLLYEVLNAIDYPSERKTSIYLLLFCGWFLAILNLGTHYSLTRYALPLYFVLLIERRISRGDARSYAIADLEILLFTAVLLLYSPETAIAYGITSLALFPILARRRDAAFLPRLQLSCRLSPRSSSLLQGFTFLIQSLPPAAEPIAFPYSSVRTFCSSLSSFSFVLVMHTVRLSIPACGGIL